MNVVKKIAQGKTGKWQSDKVGERESESEKRVEEDQDKSDAI